MIGIDVGGTKVAAARIDGSIALDAVERPTDTDNAEELLDGIEAAAREVIEAVGAPDAIGVGMPSQVDWESGTVVSSVNIPLAGVAVRDVLSERLGAPVFVDNDANCAALAEAQLVPDPPAAELVMLTLGTGVGGGIVIGGRIYRGATGLGAELGHVVIEPHPDGPGDTFARRGTLEYLCSGRGLEREASARIGRRVSGREAVTAAREGNADALAVLAQHAVWLGRGIAGVVNTFEPERVVIGGGLSAAADLFLDAAAAEAALWALPALWDRTVVELARGGPQAGVIGAGVLAAQELSTRKRASGDTPTHDQEGAERDR